VCDKYNKKKRKDTSLEFLKYSSKISESNNKGPNKKQESSLVINSRLENEYMFPKLPKPPVSYDDCRY
jgi:hypothetical protein